MDRIPGRGVGLDTCPFWPFLPDLLFVLKPARHVHSACTHLCAMEGHSAMVLEGAEVPQAQCSTTAQGGHQRNASTPTTTLLHAARLPAIPTTVRRVGRTAAACH